MRPGKASSAFRVLGVAMALFAIGRARAQETTNGLAFADFLLAPLRVHLLTATNEPAVHTTLTSNDVTRILGKVNRVWAQAGITFYLESLRTEPAANAAGFRENVKTNEEALLKLRPEASKATNVFHVYYLKQFGPNGICIRGINFVKDTARLKEIEGGIDEPLPRVTSHELGHALTLPHRQDVTNLLASGTTGTWFNSAEIQQTREAAKKKPWIESASALLGKAVEAAKSGRKETAQELLRKLDFIPLPSREKDGLRRELPATTRKP